MKGLFLGIDSMKQGGANKHSGAIGPHGKIKFKSRFIAQRDGAEYLATLGTTGRLNLRRFGHTASDFFVGGDCYLAGFLGHEVGADEGVDVTVEDAVDVADFKLRAVILDEAIGLHDVGTDLAAEGNVELGVVELVGVLLALLHFQVVELGAQHLHGEVAIFALAAFDLAGDDGVGGQVRDAHGGLDLVDVLPALAAGAIGVDAQVFGADIDFDAIVDFGNHEDRG